MNILLEYEFHSPTSELITRKFQAISKLIDFSIRSIKLTNVGKYDLLWADIVISIRGNSRGAYELAKMTKQSGKIHCVSYDDDLLNASDELVSKNRKKFVRSILGITDVVLTTSSLIGEDYYNISGKPYILNNALVTEENILKHQKAHQGVRVVYAGNKQHSSNIARILNPIIERIEKELFNVISIDFIGAHPEIEFEPKRIQITYHSLMPFDRYRDHMRNAGYDIGLAMIQNTDFAKRKYFNKYIEYASNGICGIYSDCIPYTNIITNEFNGLLCDEEPDNWFKAIKKLAEEKKFREGCIQNSQAVLREKLSAEMYCSSVGEELLKMHVQHVKSESTKAIVFNRTKLILNQSKFINRENITKLFFYLRRYGLIDTLSKIQTHFVDKKNFEKK